MYMYTYMSYLNTDFFNSFCSFLAFSTPTAVNKASETQVILQNIHNIHVLTMSLLNNVDTMTQCQLICKRRVLVRGWPVRQLFSAYRQSMYSMFIS